MLAEIQSRWKSVSHTSIFEVINLASFCPAGQVDTQNVIGTTGTRDRYCRSDSIHRRSEISYLSPSILRHTTGAFVHSISLFYFQFRRIGDRDLCRRNSFMLYRSSGGRNQFDTKQRVSLEILRLPEKACSATSCCTSRKNVNTRSF